MRTGKSMGFIPQTWIGCTLISATNPSSPLIPASNRIETSAGLPQIPQLLPPAVPPSRVLAWLKAFAKERSLEWRQDETGNCAICRPGSAGGEMAAPVVIQGHGDMVGRVWVSGCGGGGPGCHPRPRGHGGEGVRAEGCPSDYCLMWPRGYCTVARFLCIS